MTNDRGKAFFEPSVAEMFRYAETVADLVGRDWLARETTRSERNLRTGKKNLRNHSYLLAPEAHPLVGLFQGLNQWRSESLITKRFAMHEGALKLAVLGWTIETAKQAKNFERILRRFRLADHFDSACFEALVAGAYISQGHCVEFLEEVAGAKTSDLKVTHRSGVTIWVECKRRNPTTARERSSLGSWNKMTVQILKFLEERKLNAAISITTFADSTETDIDPLVKLVSRMLVECKNTRRDVEITSEDKKYCVFVRELTPFGQEIRAPHAEIEIPGASAPFIMKVDQSGIHALSFPEEFSSVAMPVEGKLEHHGATYRNPKLVAIKPSEPFDRVSGIVDALKAAAKQLPETGPGVIWICIPDNSWQSELQSSFEKARHILQAELSGEHNRRVNRVIVQTKIFEQLVRSDGTRGLRYRPLNMNVLHSNPRSPIPTP